jgi:tetratricopeptide (TPR) repeat protein
MPLFRLRSIFCRNERNPDRRLLAAVERAAQPDDASSSALLAAIQEAERALATSPTPRRHLLLGQAHETFANQFLAWDARAEYLRRALDHYEAAVGMTELGDANRVEAAWHAGCLLAGQHHLRDPQRAVPYLRQVIDSVSGYHPAYYFLGEALVWLKDFDAAEDVFRHGLALDPSQEGIRRVLHYLPLDRANEAARRLDWADVKSSLAEARVTDELAEAQILLGDAHAALGDTEAARRAWQQALRIEPGRPGMEKRFRQLEIIDPD